MLRVSFDRSRVKRNASVHLKKKNVMTPSWYQSLIANRQSVIQYGLTLIGVINSWVVS